MKAEVNAKLAGMIGLAARAGKVSAGEFSAERSISGRKARLCILADDSSENTKKHFNDMCAYRDIAIIEGVADKERLGHMIGKKERAVITIDNEGFAKTIKDIFEGGRANGD